MTDKSLINTLQALVATRQRRQLKALDPRGALNSKRVAVDYTAPARGTGGGIASPLTEKTKNVGTEGAPILVADREYFTGGLPSSDGLLILPAIKKQTFTDANGETVVIDFATPGTLP